MITAKEWLEAFARQLEIPPLEDPTIEMLLELAGIAAHDSERIAAPIACYLVGRTGMSPGTAIELARLTVAVGERDD